ncbi:hypothetical protein [Bradyrhizobium sp. LHD-71]|uniref:hypothetical protein n=1 Tax=Bradyrhizobium sp. LHD-71 TaxID=3072141 RepID=UPI0028103139|nr:hypothetical protein [Bradyrhizobium sp. LHD-71]MDQ8727194.1 hypothetical protein [Bradyrhizobium sp. LHD-71]
MRAFSPASMISTMVALSLAIPAAQAAPAQTNTDLTVTPTGTQAAETIVTLTAKVAQGAGPGGAAGPAGTVKFCVGTADLGKCNGHLLLGMAQLDTNGQALTAAHAMSDASQLGSCCCVASSCLTQHRSL